MARCGFAEWNPSGATPGGAIDPIVTILHVTAGEGDAHPHSGLEWHFEIFYDGRIQQQVDTNLRADANYRANPFAISIETEGIGSGWWTPAQIESIVKLIRWINEVHPKVLLRVCPAWNEPGLGYHIMFGSPGYWTNQAKSCPGANRIWQFNNIIMPALLEEDSMLTPEQAGQLAEIHQSVRQWGVEIGWRSKEWIQQIVSSIVNDQPMPDVNEQEIAGAILSALPDMMTKISDDDLHRIAVAVAEEDKRRVAASR